MEQWDTELSSFCKKEAVRDMFSYEKSKSDFSRRDITFLSPSQALLTHIHHISTRSRPTLAFAMKLIKV